MSEIQLILINLADLGITDNEIATHLDCSREAVNKTRRGYGRYTGTKFLPALRTLAENYGLAQLPLPQSQPAKRIAPKHSTIPRDRALTVQTTNLPTTQLNTRQSTMQAIKANMARPITIDAAYIEVSSVSPTIHIQAFSSKCPTCHAPFDRNHYLDRSCPDSPYYITPPIVQVTHKGHQTTRTLLTHRNDVLPYDPDINSLPPKRPLPTTRYQAPTPPQPYD